MPALGYGIWLRCARAAQAFLYGDEVHSLEILHLDWAELAITFKRGSGLALPMLQRASADLLGPGVLAYRLPLLLAGAAGALLLLPVGRRLAGWPAACVAAVAVALSPIEIYYSHFGRSYALLGPLSLLLALSIQRATGAGRSRWGWLGLVALATALLPWAHLTAACVVVALALAGLFRLLALGGVERLRFGGLAAALGLGLLACLLVHLPARDAVWSFLSKRVGGGEIPVGVLDVFEVLAGSRAAGIGLLVGALAGSAWWLWLDRREAVIPVFAALLVPAGVLVTQPFGSAYAYARYCLVSLPFLYLVVAWLIVTAGERLHRHGRSAGLLLGVALAVAAFATSPARPRPGDSERFANTYLRLRPIAAFDRPFSQAPALYARIAEDAAVERIIEVPQLKARFLLLYRNYARLHGKDTWIGVAGRDPATVPAGPYISLADPDFAAKGDADYLILHRDLRQELRSYWIEVFNRHWDGESDAAFMERFRDRSWGFMRWELLGASPPGLEEQLKRRLGPPVFRDRYVSAWRLR